MKTYNLLFALSLVVLFGCGDKFEQEPYVTGEHAIYFEHTSVCLGATTKARLVKTGSNKELPMSEIVFEPLEPQYGTISPSGIYTAPNSLPGNLPILIKARFKKGGLEIVTGGLSLLPTGLHPETWTKPATTELQGKWQFDQFENGDFLFTNEPQGWGSTPNPTYELTQISIDGTLKEKKTFGSGYSKFAKIRKDRVYVAGYKPNVVFGGSVITVFDNQLNQLLEIIIPESSIEAFAADYSGHIYVHTWEDFGKSIYKIKEDGTIIWRSQLGYDFLSLEVFEDGKIAGLVRDKGDLDKEALILLNENGEEIWLKPTGRRATESSLFLLPNEQIGLASEMPYNELNPQIWILDRFTKDGAQVSKNETFLNSYKHDPSIHPTEQLRILGPIHHVKVSSQGEVLVVGVSSWGSNLQYLHVASSTGKIWSWWQMTSSNFSFILPYGISEVEDGFVVLAQVGGSYTSFKLSKDLSLNPCLYPGFFRVDNP